jgi:hypothetical protein
MNSERFLADQRTYFSGSYKGFCDFGGPCVYFHRECIHAGHEAFLSERHIEMLYATLTAWGMHRMGDTEKAKTKLTEWRVFRDSLLARVDALKSFQGVTLVNLSESEYSEAISNLQSSYRVLKLSVSDATIVANSKALFHLLPDLIPPIDRQYTVRFFTQKPQQWRNRKGKFTTVTLPKDLDGQFRLFRTICLKVKRLADRIDPDLLQRERNQNDVSAPKAIDNAIVNYVRIVAATSSGPV